MTYIPPTRGVSSGYVTRIGLIPKNSMTIFQNPRIDLNNHKMSLNEKFSERNSKATFF